MKEDKTDLVKVLEMADRGATIPEIMKAFGLGSTTSARLLYLRALEECGRVKPLVKDRVEFPVVLEVPSRGGLKIPRKVLEAAGLEPGARVLVGKSRKGLVLGPAPEKEAGGSGKGENGGDGGGEATRGGPAMEGPPVADVR